MRIIRLFAVFTAFFAFAGCATPPASGPASVAASDAPFVVAANPLAADAGSEALRRGGSAVDAAIAMQAVLSLVEPQSSSMAGGAFLTFYDARSRGISVYDGRETAPAQASETMFLKPDGSPLPFGEAVVSGRATGVPGVLAMLDLAHREHGRLRWSTLFSAAEGHAEEGFVVSPRLARMIAGRFPQNAVPDTVAYFTKADGTRLAAGDRLVNKPYAAFLRRLAAQGPAALYAGETGARIVAKTRAGPLGGSMTMADLAAYRPIKREALCRPWRAYLACVPPPPASGVGLLQLLLMLERTDIAKRGPADPQAWFLFAEASRLMYADRDFAVADPAFVGVNVGGLLSPAYVAARAAMIGATAGPPPEPGRPEGMPAYAADRTREPMGTTHFIVRDAAGNVVSMTSTVESVFGTGRMVDGFFLNNQLTDFSFAPRDKDGRLAANAVAPGKRPRSSMVPTILLDRSRHFAGAFGSAGGSAILAYVAKSMVAAVDWGLPVQAALDQPNLVARGASFQGEVGKFAPEVLAGLKARGIELKPGQGEDSGVHAVLVRNGRVEGGADPRREGVVRLLGD